MEQPPADVEPVPAQSLEQEQQELVADVAHLADESDQRLQPKKEPEE